MNLINIFTVHPIPLKPHSKPEVIHKNHFLLGDSLDDAFKFIEGNVDVVDAFEVYGINLGESQSVRQIAGPCTLMTNTWQAADHAHWRAVQKRYSLISRGPQSIEEFFTLQFQERQSRLA